MGPNLDSCALNNIGALSVPALKTALPRSADFTFIADGRDKWGLGFDEQLRIIMEAKARFFAALPDEGDIGVAVFLADEHGILIGETTPISEAMGKYLDFLQRKNMHLVNFARRRIKY